MKRRVLAAVDDIFFLSKIRGTAESLGVEFDSARTVEAAIEKSRANRPDVVIADLHSQRCDPFALARDLKDDPELRDVPLIGFFSHVQTELRDRALASGFDRVLARSAFSSQLVNMLGELAG
ncbi:MAG: response regulator [Pyrinomonadaceae bacterium]